MENKIFKEKGVGSLAWYLQVIKTNPDRKGFSYLRKGTPLQFDAVKTAVEYLVGARYLDKHSKPDQPRNDSYTVTSFGHRYLEQHKDTIEDAVERQTEEIRSTGTITTAEALSEAKKRVDEKSAAIGSAAIGSVDKVSDLIGKSFLPQTAPAFVPSVPETPEQRKKDLGKSYRFERRTTVEEDDNTPDDAFDDIRTPKVRAVAEEMPVPTAEAQPGDKDEPEADGRAVPDNSDTDDLVGTLKRISGEILFDRYAKEVTVVDLIERIEKR